MTQLEKNMTECLDLIREMVAAQNPTMSFGEIKEKLKATNDSSVQHFLRKRGIKAVRRGRYPRLAVISAISG